MLPKDLEEEEADGELLLGLLRDSRFNRDDDVFWMEDDDDDDGEGGSSGRGLMEERR